jgi:methionyl-tRNA synthetase
MSNKIYLTTPIYYANDKPHIGHAFTTLCADFLARYYRSIGKEVYFMTGLDEHGQKIVDTAEEAGKDPQIFVDELAEHYKKYWEQLNIKYDYFIRTTDKDHEEKVKEVFQKLYDQGDLYKGNYKGKYCVSCEAYYGDDDLIDNEICPIHKKPVTILEEETYFFKLSKYEDYIKELFEKEDFILAPRYKNEMLARINEGLRDVSVSRKKLKWGIPLPFDKEHVIYVWFDALLNYYTGSKGYWPPKNLIGKDILWFHSVYWPAILKAIGIEAPQLYVHGYWSVEGEKMGKSLNNFITIEKLTKYGVDTGRYFVLRQMSYGEDSDFNSKMFAERYDELANNVGNLVNRVAVISSKNELDLSKFDSVDDEIKNKIFETYKVVGEELDKFKIQSGLAKVMEFAQFLNKYINDKEPWKLVKEDKDATAKILYDLTVGIEFLGLILEPVIPSKSLEIRDIFGFKLENLSEFLDLEKKQLKLERITKIEPKILFPKFESFEF